MQTREEFIAYLEEQLIPDLRESGRDETADDFATCVDLLAPMRYAIVRQRAGMTDQIASYLPANYSVLGRTPIRASDEVQILIGGQDRAGWTLDEYVIPRLASGLIHAEEIA